MKTITVATQKGGAGKSTVAIHIAVAALQDRARNQVAMINLDPQRSLIQWANAREAEDPIVIDATPGQLPELIETAERDEVDWLVIDTPPHAGSTIAAAVRASDLVIVPIRPGTFDINAAKDTVSILQEAAKPGLFLLNQVPPQGSEGDDTEAVLKDLHPDVPVASQRMTHLKAYMRALIEGKAITEFERAGSRSHTEVQNLFRIIKKRMT